MVYFAKFSKSAPEVRIWLQTSSVREPMNWGVAFRSWSSAIASTMLPMLYQREDLRRCEKGVRMMDEIVGLDGKDMVVIEDGVVDVVG